MKIKSIHISGFGKISDADYKFDDIFVLCEKNGYGKTTIVAFISAMLYGLQSARKNAKEFSDREHYYPINGGSFGGNIEIEFKGDTYRIERTFGEKSSTDDKIKIYKNGSESTPSGEEPGEAFFGLKKESFERLITINQSDFSVETGDDINRRLNNFAEGKSEDFDLQKTLKKIKEKKKTFTDAVKTKRSEISAAREKAADIEELKSKRDSLSGDYIEAGKKFEDLQAEQEKALVAEAIKEKWKHYDSLLDGIKKSEENLTDACNTLENYEKKKAAAVHEKKADIPVIILFVLACLFIASGIYLIIAMKKLFILGITAAVIGIFCGIIAIIRNKNLKESKVQKDTENDALEEHLKETITKNKKDLEIKKGEAEEYKNSNGLFERPSEKYNLDEIKADGKKALNDYNNLFVNIGKLDDQIHEYEAESAGIADLNNELDDLKKNEELYDILYKELGEADKLLKEKYVAPIKKSFVTYSTLLDSYFGDKVRINKNFNVLYEECGKYSNVEHLSAGNLAILAICYRLALLDNMFGEEQPFIVMDDPFVNLDAENLEKVKKLVALLSNRKQILYFCCHESRKI